MEKELEEDKLKSGVKSFIPLEKEGKRGWENRLEIKTQRIPPEEVVFSKLDKERIERLIKRLEKL